MNPYRRVIPSPVRCRDEFGSGKKKLNAKEIKKKKLRAIEEATDDLVISKVNRSLISFVYGLVLVGCCSPRDLGFLFSFKSIWGFFDLGI